MGDQNTPLTAADARQFIRRTGFGIAAKESRKYTVGGLTGLTRGQAADLFLTFRPKSFLPKAGESLFDAHNKWLKFMLKAKKSAALQEKLVLFLHDHFATSFTTIANQLGGGEAVTMLSQQNRLLRKNCIGNFKTLVKLINTNPAMMSFLDTQLNKKEEPNENYARELCELFTVGVRDLNGYVNYEQGDVVQIARAFTGWQHQLVENSAHMSAASHDTTAEFPARGPKAIFGGPHPELPAHTVGGFAGPQSFIAGGEGENEIDEVTEILFQHTDSDGENTIARHLARKLIEYFCYPDPAKAVIDEIVSVAGFVGSWELVPLLRAIFVHDVFYETAAAAPFGALTKKSVRWPIDYVLGTMRALAMRPRGRELQLQGGEFNYLYDLLVDMGQTVLDPPSVFGWKWEEAWISGAGLMARYRFVRDLVTARHGKAFKPKKLIDLDLTDPGEIVDAVTDQLGITDQFTATQRQHLVDYLTDNGAQPTLDLDDDDTRNRKLHGLYGLVLQSAAAVLH
jgi:uncharacterized protein (DUF1800 family)